MNSTHILAAIIGCFLGCGAMALLQGVGGEPFDVDSRMQDADWTTWQPETKRPSDLDTLTQVIVCYRNGMISLQARCAGSVYWGEQGPWTVVAYKVVA